MNPGPAANSIQDAFSTVKSRGKNGITIGHTNVQGLYTNLAQVKLLAFNTNLDVLAISETHLSPALKEHEIAIQGYQILRRDRIGRTGGGVVKKTVTKTSSWLHLSSARLGWFVRHIPSNS